MSADASLTFFGIRYSLASDEIANVEIRKHPIVLKARAAGLSFYFCNVGGVGPEEYYLYVGVKVGIAGHENDFAVELSAQEIKDILSDVESKLINAGFSESPKLYIQWLPDV